MPDCAVDLGAKVSSETPGTSALVFPIDALCVYQDVIRSQISGFQLAQTLHNYSHFDTGAITRYLND